MDWRASPPSGEAWARLRQLPGALASEFQPAIRPAGVAATSPQPAVVRVICTTEDGLWMGTGVLVRPPVECKVGIVLTVDHGIPSRPDSVVVVFHDCRVTGIVLGRDASLDLAVLSIPMPRTLSYEIATEPPRVDDVLWAGGYAGPKGGFQVVSGKLLDYVTPDDPPGPEGSVLMLTGSVETGVSGGPIADYRGRLVGIVSGGDHEVVVGTHCVFIREFLNRVLSPATPKRMSPMNPMVPPPATEPPAAEPSRPPTVADHLDKIRGQGMEKPEAETLPPPVDPTEAIGANDKRVAEIQAGIAEAIGANDKRLAAIKSRFEEAAAETRERMESIATRKSALELAVPSLFAALGWTGPPSVVALLAARFGLAAWRRRKARKATKPDVQPPPPPTYDDYATQLAEVYALSGRSPMSDLTLGREYDQELRQAATSSDGDLARWAQELRQRVANRLQRIHNPMPTAVEPIGA